MLVMLSEHFWRRIGAAMQEIKSDGQDMYLISEVLGLEIMLLPEYYAAVNGRWEVKRHSFVVQRRRRGAGDEHCCC